MKKDLTYCFLCHSSEIRSLKKAYAGKGLVRCAHCGFIFMGKLPTDEELQAYYSVYSYGGEEMIPEATRKSYGQLLTRFEKFRKNNLLLDIGCGTGSFLESARDRQWQVQGTEYSEKAVEICVKKGLDVIRMSAEQSPGKEGKYDVVTLFEVIEHITNPNEVFRNVHTLLRPGGLFYCTTPNFNSLMRMYLKENYTDLISYPEHLGYFTRNTLKKLGNYHSFRTARIAVTGISVSALSKPSSKSDAVIEGNRADEALRKKMGSHFLLRLIKRLANFFLSLTGLGVTLKGYFIKN